MKKIYLNNSFEYTEELNENFLKGSGKFKKVRIPHTVEVLPSNYTDSDAYQKNVYYRYLFDYDTSFKNKRVFINFDGVAHKATVSLNGKVLGEHLCGYTAFKYEITKLIKKTSKNVLTVEVDSRENLNIPPFGGAIDYLTYGGIYRDVYLSIEPKTFIEDVFVKTLKDGDTWYLDLDLSINGEYKDEKPSVRLFDDEGEMVLEIEESLDAFHINAAVEDVTEWDIDNPYLYHLELSFKDSVYECKVGFRTAEFREDGFYLNNKKIKLRGLNRHQSYPYVGYAIPDSMQREDVRLLKDELACNVVRTSHYPQSQAFIDECDERGLLVFTEIPGWQHIGNEEWKEVAINNTREMIMQYRNHPSIILWGVRINESLDDDALYTETNNVARMLDNTRSTSGVRYLTGSSLLEDVYAHNDFSFAGDFSLKGLKSKKDAVKNKASMKKGYIVSEFNGHMFPTKSYDNNAKRQEQALRHAQVLDAMYECEDVAGAIGWCMFDYNTHDDFGSGDKVCYHGVMDSFRNPKLAASIYASQGEEKDVLEISSSMEIGDYAAGNVGEVYAFTNADSVKLYKGDKFVKEFYPSNRFSNLPHPPILIDDFIGDLIKEEGYSDKVTKDIKECLLAVAKHGLDNIPNNYKLKLAKMMAFNGLKMDDATRLYNKYISGWGGIANNYRFEAIKNGEVVKTVVKGPARKLHLSIEVTHTELVEDKSYDVSAVRFKVLDENNNIASYANEVLYLSCAGNVEIIGPDVVALQGGMGGTYIRSTGKSGTGTLVIDGDRYKASVIEFKVKKSRK
ncbi:MAG: glycoside hydrolase family 2 TIM barrel-domain containing protein [Erysipelotrichaceae bacterium]|nr:glycoside hydrolase family 2 TIM barrel-domain containing protein [Erysipelotrichaceae bacterium]